MRRQLAILFAIWAAAACAVDSNAAPTAAPSPSASALATPIPETIPDAPDNERDRFRKGPDASAPDGRAAQPSAAPSADAVRAAMILTPTVIAVATAYPVDPMPTRAATAAELSTLRAPVNGWVDSFTGMLERRRHPQPGVDPELDLRSMFTDPRLSLIVTRSLAPGTIFGQPTLTAAGWSLDGAVMRAWGTPAYVDITVNAVDHGATDLPIRWVLRLQPVGFWFRAVDLREPATGGWVLGTAPRYSALELETEMGNAVAGYLNNESFSSFRPSSVASGAADTPFFRARMAAIEDLNRQYAADTFRERYFENVSSSIERFEPAWFGGDGIVTLTVSGRVVETRNNGTKLATSFTQRLKFLRTPDSWTAVDAQNDDGTWASGGNLALAEVARPHG